MSENIKVDFGEKELKKIWIIKNEVPLKKKII